MPTTPFESISVDHLTGVTGGCGGCKKQQPPPPPQAAAPPAEPATNISVSITGYGSAPIQKTATV